MKQKETLQLQNLILNNARKTKMEVIIFLMNGVQIRGLIKSFDDYCILIEKDGAQQMIYKHNISTITPGTGKVLMPFIEKKE